MGAVRGAENGPKFVIFFSFHFSPHPEIYFPQLLRGVFTTQKTINKKQAVENRQCTFNTCLVSVAIN